MESQVQCRSARLIPTPPDGQFNDAGNNGNGHAVRDGGGQGNRINQQAQNWSHRLQVLEVLRRVQIGIRKRVRLDAERHCRSGTGTPCLPALGGPGPLREPFVLPCFPDRCSPAAGRGIVFTALALRLDAFGGRTVRSRRSGQAHMPMFITIKCGPIAPSRTFRRLVGLCRRGRGMVSTDPARRGRS